MEIQSNQELNMDMVGDVVVVLMIAPEGEKARNFRNFSARPEAHDRDLIITTPQLMANPFRLHLTLFSGNPSCSLCEIAKAALSAVASTSQIPYTLTIHNLQASDSSSTEIAYDTSMGKETKREVPGLGKEKLAFWKRKYQYDIPVLHGFAMPVAVEEANKDVGEEIMRHRIDEAGLQVILKRWKEVGSGIEG